MKSSSYLYRSSFCAARVRALRSNLYVRPMLFLGEIASRNGRIELGRCPATNKRSRSRFNDTVYTPTKNLFTRFYLLPRGKRLAMPGQTCVCAGRPLYSFDINKALREKIPAGWTTRMKEKKKGRKKMENKNIIASGIIARELSSR